jgi:hypothetical protein
MDRFVIWDLLGLGGFMMGPCVMGLFVMGRFVIGRFVCESRIHSIETDGQDATKTYSAASTVHCLKTAASTFGTSHAALNYSLCGGHYNHCVIFGAFLRVICFFILEYAIYSGSNIPAYSTYSSVADTDNA